MCLNTKYQRCSGQQWIFSYPSGTKAQLDYVLVNKKWKNSALNCRSYNTFVNISSDHRIVSARFCLKLRANKTKTALNTPYDWTKLHSDENICKAFTLNVKNRFALLQIENETNCVNQTYNNFETACKEAATENIPLKPKIRQRVPWENEDIAKKVVS